MLSPKVLIFDVNQTLADLAPSSTSISMSTPPDRSCGCARRCTASWPRAWRLSVLSQ